MGVILLDIEKISILPQSFAEKDNIFRRLLGRFRLYLFTKGDAKYLMSVLRTEPANQLCIEDAKIIKIIEDSFHFQLKFLELRDADNEDPDFSEFQDQIGYYSENEHVTLLNIYSRKNTDLDERIELPFEIGSLEYIKMFNGVKIPFFSTLPPSERYALLQIIMYEEFRCTDSLICTIINGHVVKLISHGAHFPTLPRCIDQLSYLEVLHMEQDGMEELPESIGNLKNLKTLNLSGNEIRFFPESICDLSRLEKIDASQNQIESLPDRLGCLQNLKSLWLDANLLLELPKTLGDLQNLEYLGLSHNQLKLIPDTIGDFQHLKVLHLSENNDLILPKSIFKLTQLERVYLPSSAYWAWEKEGVDFFRYLMDSIEKNRSPCAIALEHPSIKAWSAELQAQCRILPESAGSKRILVRLQRRGRVF